MQDSFQSTVKGVIDSGDFNINDFVPSADGTTLILKEKDGDKLGQSSKKYILPDLKSIANGIIGENLPTTTEGAPIISIDEGTLNGGVPNGNIVQAPDPSYRKGDVSKYEIGRIYVDANGKKFMFLKNTQKQVGNRIVTVVDIKSRFYFDPR